MNDDELIEALRRTLHSQASSVRPSRSTAPLPKGRQARATSPRRRVLFLGSVSTALAAATAAIVFALTQSPQPSSTVSITNPPPGPNTTAVPPTTTPVTTVPTPPTTVPLPQVQPGFQPLSMTFVSARTGWALGTVPCAAGSCLSVARTSDGGKQWGAVGAPQASLSAAQLAVSGAANIRFGDGYNGWIVLTGSNNSQLWSSHDGGLSWVSVPTPGGNAAQIYDIESSNDMAYLVAYTPGAPSQRIYSTPVDSDTWASAAVTISNGGGPVPSAQIVLFGRAGWITGVNRVVTGGAILGPSGWSTWTPPCSTANGAAHIAAASATDVVAMCQEGAWGPPATGTAAGTEWLYTSSDGGKTFTPVGSVPASPSSIAVAAGDPSIIVAATGDKLVGTFDGGKSWTTVAGSTSAAAFTFVGFTTAAQGVAIEQTPGTTAPAYALMTYDGGKTWNPVNF